jgi:hypothetical protein
MSNSTSLHYIETDVSESFLRSLLITAYKTYITSMSAKNQSVNVTTIFPGYSQPCSQHFLCIRHVHIQLFWNGMRNP